MTKMTKTKWNLIQKTMTKTKSTFPVKINAGVGEDLVVSLSHREEGSYRVMGMVLGKDCIDIRPVASSPDFR